MTKIDSSSQCKGPKSAKHRGLEGKNVQCCHWNYRKEGKAHFVEVTTAQRWCLR